MKYLQVAMRRNGLHAIRGWCLNQLQLCPGIKFDKSGDELENISWFSWSIREYEIDYIVDKIRDLDFTTLESFPISVILDIVNKVKDITVILHIRELKDWLASSVKFSYIRYGQCEFEFHKKYIDIWREYLNLTRFIVDNFVVIWFDEWFSSVLYRQALAEMLGIEGYDGSPYQEVHGIQYSSFDGKQFEHTAQQMNVLHRDIELVNDPNYQELLAYGLQIRSS